MAKAFILAMSPLEDDTTNQHQDEEDGKEADGGDKPGLSDKPSDARTWSLRRIGKGRVCQLWLVQKGRFHLQTDWFRERAHACSVEGGQANSVNNRLGKIAEQERRCRWLQGEVGDKAVVGEDLNLEAGQLSVQIGLAGTTPVGDSSSGVQKLELHLGW